MCFEAPLPTWKQIIRRNAQRTNTTYYEEINNEVLFFSELYTSICLIVDAIRIEGNKDQVTILVPDFYSKKAIPVLQKNWVRTVYYPVDANLTPDWDYIKEWTKENTFDAFVITHFFGKFSGSISRAKEISKNFGALLIEDCTHALYPTGKMGTGGDFVIYCPLKQLPVMDGEVLFCNNGRSEYGDNVFSQIQQQYGCMQEEAGTAAWYTEKALQKIILSRRENPFHSRKNYETDAKRSWNPKKISSASYHTLCDYTYTELKKVAYLRRENLDMMNYIMSRLYPEATPLLSREVDAPYVAAYLIDKAEIKGTITKDLTNKGFPLLLWENPLKDNEAERIGNSIFGDVILLPIHQNITPQMLVKKIL